MKCFNGSKIRQMLIGFVVALAVAGFAQARTITVGSGAGYDCDTIQAGIDAATDGDTVLVAPGEYVITEPVTFRGKAITVKSETGPDETTIRMGTPADTNRGSVVVFENGETAESVLEGFTITGGRGSLNPSDGIFYGGGIVFNTSSATVRNCAIVQNRADVESRGGGVCCVYPCSPSLIDCIIAENSSVGLSGGGLSVCLRWVLPDPNQLHYQRQLGRITGRRGNLRQLVRDHDRLYHQWQLNRIRIWRRSALLGRLVREHQ